jgi:MFS family permease
VRAEPSPGRATPAAAPPTTPGPAPAGQAARAYPVEEIQDALVDADRALAPGSARAALRHALFRRVFAGSFLSNIGTWMQNVVLGALAYDLTESSTFVGIVLFAQLGPMLLLSVVGGALADTLDRRRLLITVALSQMALAFVLAAVTSPADPNKVVMVAVVFAIGVGQAFFNPTYSAMLPQLVGRRDLPGAISLHSAQMNGSRVVGPAIGGVLFATLGAPAVFAVNGVSYLFVVATLLTVRLPAAPPGGGVRGRPP